MTLRRRRAECLLMVCNKAAKPAAMQYLFLPKPACPLIHDQSDQRRLQKVIICWSSSHSGSSAAQKRWWSRRQKEFRSVRTEPSGTWTCSSCTITTCTKGQEPCLFFGSNHYQTFLFSQTSCDVSLFGFKLNASQKQTDFFFFLEMSEKENTHFSTSHTTNTFLQYVSVVWNLQVFSPVLSK